MINHIKSNLLKLKATKIFVLVTFLSIGLGLFSSIITCLRPLANSTYDRFSIFYFLLSLSFLFFSGIFIKKTVEIEEEAGNLINVLRWKNYRSKDLISRIIIYFILILESTFISLTSFIIISNIMNKDILDFKLLLYLSSVLLVYTMIIILIYTFLAFKFSMSIVGIKAILLILISILIGTTDLGGDIWIFIPYTWFYKSLYSLMPIFLGKSYGWQIAKKLLVILPIVGIIILVTEIIILLIWFRHLEQRPKMEV